MHARASLFHYLPFTTTKSSSHYAQAFIQLFKPPASPEKARIFLLILSLLVRCRPISTGSHFFAMSKHLWHKHFPIKVRAPSRGGRLDSDYFNVLGRVPVDATVSMLISITTN